MVNSANKGWWCDFYDSTYADLYLFQSPNESLALTLEFLENALQISSGDLVFDQCCGTGRVSVPLAKRTGCRVIGVDQSAGYISHAQSQAKDASISCAFVQGDAYEFVTDQLCDAGLNWYASCGNDQDDRENLRMFERAYESLRTGAWFACDYIHVPRLLSDGCRSVEICHKNPQGEEVTAAWRSTPVWETGMVRVEVTLSQADGLPDITKCGENRLYMPHELIGLLRQCGFANFRLYGSPAGEDMQIDSGHCIVVCQKPLLPTRE